MKRHEPKDHDMILYADRRPSVGNVHYGLTVLRVLFQETQLECKSRRLKIQPDLRRYRILFLKRALHEDGKERAMRGKKCIGFFKMAGKEQGVRQGMNQATPIRTV
eukprot:4662341-Pleurochrysis_carterae.AAC.2